MIVNIFKNRWPLIIFLVLYVVVSVFSFKSYGLTNDESEEYFLGKLLYTKLRAEDPNLEKNFVYDDGQSPNLLRHDRIYLAFLYGLNQSENYEQYHLLNLLFASILLIASYEIILMRTKNGWLALLGPVFILLTPRLFGHFAANLKDMPFAIFYFLSLTLILKLKNHDQPFSILLLGLGFGLTQSTRIVGYSIYLVYILFSMIQFENNFSLKYFLNLLSRTAVIFLIGFLIHMITLPYLGADPFSHFIFLLKSGTNFPWQGPILYTAKVFSETSLPWHYIPVWFLITTPIFILLLWAYSFKFLKQKQPVAQLFWLTLVINMGLFFLLKPIVYDGLRHMLFLLPIISTLAGWSLIDILLWPKLKSKQQNLIRNQQKKLIIVGVVINAGLVIISICQLFPYQYIYFNQLVGGLAGATHQFEQDYWGASYKEAVEWFNHNVQLTQDQKVTICGDPAQYQAYALVPQTLTQDIEEADYLICHRRAGNDQKMAQFSKLLFQLERQGVALTEIRSKK